MLNIGKKVREARNKNGMSLRELATHVEVSPSLLSQIENGKANPSVDTLYKIARELGVPVDHFFPTQSTEAPPKRDDATPVEMSPGEFQASRDNDIAQGTDATFDDGDNAPIVRANDRPMIELRGGVTWARLTAEAEANIEFLEIEYPSGSSSGEVMSHHGGREFGLVLEGTLTLHLGFECHELHPGDSIIFDSRTPHRLVNNGEVAMRAVWVVFNR